MSFGFQKQLIQTRKRTHSHCWINASLKTFCKWNSTVLTRCWGRIHRTAWRGWSQERWWLKRRSHCCWNMTSYTLKTRDERVSRGSRIITHRPSPHQPSVTTHQSSLVSDRFISHGFISHQQQWRASNPLTESSVTRGEQVNALKRVTGLPDMDWSW